MAKSKAWRAQRQQARTKRHESKRRDVRNEYRPRTKPARRRQIASHHHMRRAVDFSLLHHWLMGRAA